LVRVLLSSINSFVRRLVVLPSSINSFVHRLVVRGLFLRVRVQLHEVIELVINSCTSSQQNDRGEKLKAESGTRFHIDRHANKVRYALAESGTMHIVRAALAHTPCFVPTVGSLAHHMSFNRYVSVQISYLQHLYMYTTDAGIHRRSDPYEFLEAYLMKRWSSSTILAGGNEVAASSFTATSAGACR
jgi:hypothetical protein